MRIRHRSSMQRGQGPGPLNDGDGLSLGTTQIKLRLQNNIEASNKRTKQRSGSNKNSDLRHLDYKVFEEDNSRQKSNINL